MKRLATPLYVVLLLPFSSFSQLSAELVLDVSSLEIKANESIMSYAKKSQNFKTLLVALKAADLEDVLSYDGPFTVFAPSDAAFEKLSKHKLAELLDPDNKKELKAIMQYHIVAGNFSASKIITAMCQGSGTTLFTTIQGDELSITMQGTDILLTDTNGNVAKIIAADSNHSNGVIHEIDSVIRPNKKI